MNGTKHATTIGTHAASNVGLRTDGPSSSILLRPIKTVHVTHDTHPMK